MPTAVKTKERKPIPRPVPKSAQVSYNMRQVKGTNTKLEVYFRTLLRAAGATHYRLHKKGLPGRPDVVFVREGVCVFVHGCFWHGCPTCKLPIPKHNRPYWVDKFERNRERDKRKARELRRMGWAVITVWEHQVKKTPSKPLGRVLKKLGERGFGKN